MSKIINPFRISIYTNYVNESYFNSIKSEVLLFIKKNKDSLIKSPNWIGDTLTNIDSCKSKTINTPLLSKVIKTEVENYIKTSNSFNPLTKNLSLEDLWVNVAKPNQYQETHDHTGSLISGTLYIDVNNQSGSFQFLNPLNSEFALQGLKGGINYVHNINPSNGMILLFPSWMQHRVLPNKSTKDRISISFNIISKF